MANWNTVRTSVGHAAGKAIKKTSEVADVAALYVRLKTTEAQLDGYFTALGKLTYLQLKTGESQAEKIAPILERIEEAKKKIRALKNKIEVERAKRHAPEASVIIETAVEDAQKSKKED